MVAHRKVWPSARTAGQNNTDYDASGHSNSGGWTKAVQPESTANHDKHANANSNTLKA
jgi:hypothetical protein